MHEIDKTRAKVDARRRWPGHQLLEHCWADSKIRFVPGFIRERCSPIRENLLFRGCDPALYHVYLDEEKNIATFVLYNLTGQIVGIQQYRPDRPKNTSGGRKEGFNPYELRYFTKTKKDALAVFGVDKVNKYKKVIFVTEGIFDAIAIHALAQNAVAVLCNNPIHLEELFRCSGFDYVGVCDSGAPGKLLGDFCRRVGGTSVTCPEGKDPNSMHPSELRELLQEYL